MTTGSKGKSPAFQFYPKDMLSDGDAIAMRPHEFGIYVRLLCYDWTDDGVRDDDRVLLKLGGFEPLDFHGRPYEKDEIAAILTAVRAKFVPHPAKHGFITNPRIQKERQRQSERSEAARSSAEARWERPRGSDANAMRTHRERTPDAVRSECFASASTTASAIDDLSSTKKVPRKRGRDELVEKTEFAPGVFLTPTEHTGLTDKFGPDFVARCCEKLSAWIDQDPTPRRKRNGRNAAATFRSWVLNAVAEEQARAERVGRANGTGPPMDRVDRVRQANWDAYQQLLREEQANEGE